MQEILEIARRLGREIENSCINADYATALAKLKANPQLAEKVKTFRRTQKSYYSELPMSLEHEKHLSKLYFDLCMNPDARQFLESEKKMLNLIFDIYTHLWSGRDVGVELFE